MPLDLIAVQIIDTDSLFGLVTPVLALLLLFLGGRAIARSSALTAAESAATSWKSERDAALARAERKARQLDQAHEQIRAQTREISSLSRRTDLRPLLEQNQQFHREFVGLVREMQEETRVMGEQLAKHMESSTRTNEALTHTLDAIAKRLELT